MPGADYNNVVKLKRYIDVITILKSKNDYEVNEKYIGDAIEAYINEGKETALAFIKTRDPTNGFIKGIIAQKKLEEGYKNSNVT